MVTKLRTTPTGPARATVLLAALAVLAPAMASPLPSVHAAAYAPHAPITINRGDLGQLRALAAAEGWPGTGTASDPYIMQGYEFGPTTQWGVLFRHVKDHVVIRNNWFHDSGYGIILQGSENIRVQSNLFERTGEAVNFNWGTVNDTFVGNTVRGGNYGVAFCCTPGKGIVVANNTVSGTTSIGIYAVMSGGMRIEVNVVENNAGIGVFVTTAYAGTFRDNVVQGNSGYGLWILSAYGSTDASFEDNTIRDNGVAQVRLGPYGAGSLSVARNVVSGTAPFLIESFAARVEANTVSGGPVAINVTGGSSTLSGNVISGADIGIRLGAAARGARVEGHTLSGGTVGIDVVGGREHIIAGNSVSGAATAVRLADSYLNEIRGNRLDGNGLGLALARSEGNLVYNNVFLNDRNVEVVESADNAWNVLKTNGTNVVGGPFLGGNFWSDYVGADVDGDGLGDVGHGPVWPGLLPPEAAPVAAVVAAHLPYGFYDHHPLMTERIALPQGVVS